MNRSLFYHWERNFNLAIYQYTPEKKSQITMIFLSKPNKALFLFEDFVQLWSLCQQKCITIFCFIFTLPDWLSTKTIDGGKGMSFLSQICRESSDNPLSYLPFLCCLHFLCCMSKGRDLAKTRDCIRAPSAFFFFNRSVIVAH